MEDSSSGPHFPFLVLGHGLCLGFSPPPTGGSIIGWRTGPSIGRASFPRGSFIICTDLLVGCTMCYMNNYEKISNSVEDTPDQKKIKLLGRIVPKVTRAILETGSLDEITLDKIDRIIDKTFRNNNVAFDRDTLLCESLESIAEIDGGLPDKLEEAYEKVLAERIAGTVQKQGMDTMYEVLSEQLRALRSRNVYVDDKDVERMVIERLHFLDADSLETVEEEA